jgi:hypothetical protein
MRSRKAVILVGAGSYGGVLLGHHHGQCIMTGTARAFFIHLSVSK